MRTKLILLLSLVLAGCSPEDENTGTVNSFDSASIQRQLVGKWVYNAKAYAHSPNDLVFVSGEYPDPNFENIDTLNFQSNMICDHTFMGGTRFTCQYDFTQTFLNLHHGVTVDVFKYSFDNINTLRLGTGKDFSTFKIYRRE